MAIVDSTGNIKGIVGKVNFRLLGSQTVMQSNPGRGQVHQSPLTKNCGTDFGMASNRARIIRDILLPAIKGLADPKMINRFNAQLANVLRTNTGQAIGYRDIYGAELGLLNNFEFNVTLPFDKVFQPKITHKIEGPLLSIGIPAFSPKQSIVFPGDASECVLNILLSEIDFESGLFRYLGNRQLQFTESKDPVEALDMHLEKPGIANSLLIATVGLDYYANTGIQKIGLNNKFMNPVKILAVYQPHDHLNTPAAEVTDQLNSWSAIAGWIKRKNAATAF